MRINAQGDIIAGVGGHDVSQVSVWRHDAPAPEPLAAGAASGWLSDAVALCAGPDLFTLTAPEFQRAPFSPYMPNDSYAGGGKWIASRATENNLQGTVPPGYEAWKAHDVGPDGTMVLVLNGVYKVFWPNGTDEDFVAAQLRATSAGIVLVDVDAPRIQIYRQTTAPPVPQQLKPQKWWCVSVGRDWLLYLCDGYGLVLHSIHDASHGYQWNVAPYSPCGVTLADGRTVIAWSTGAGEQAADIHRVFIDQLGVGMSPLHPFITPPDPPELPYMRPEPKNRADMENKATDAFMKHIGGMSRQDAWQGVHQVGDRLTTHKGLYWDAYDLAVGAATRDGAPSVPMIAEDLDKLAKDCEAINTECLQRR